MGILSSIPIIGKLFDDSLKIIDQAVPDGDMRSKLIANLEEIKRKTEHEIYIAELNTVTVPWIDALHKMGRQLLSYSAIGYCILCLFLNHEISQAEMFLIGGPNIAYQIIKGKGK